MSTTNKTVLAIIGLALAACLCLSVICVGAAGFLLYTQRSETIVPTEVFQVPTIDVNPLPTIEIPDMPTEVPLATGIPTEGVPTEATPSVPVATPTPMSGGALPDASASETLKTLEGSVVPESDPILLAQEYKGAGPIEPTVPPPAQPHTVGETMKFWIPNNDTGVHRQLSATLRYATPHLYFWVEDSVKYNLTAIKKISDAFETKIYPTDRKFFGSEWSPGVDGEIPLYVVYAKNLGKNVAGFFDSSDEFPPAANQYSNAHEMFVISSDATPLTQSYDYGAFAHEFQHMIHFHTDRNEELWMNEGFSELAALLNQYNVGRADALFLQHPDLQLNDWYPDQTKNTPHYGASFLFFSYILGRFGEDTTKAIVANKDNGLDSIDEVLKQLSLKTPAGAQITADDVFADWVAANIIRDPNTSGGLYNYSVYPKAPKADPTQTFDTCPLSQQQLSVHQYAAQYLDLTCKGTYTLDFQGSAQASLLPADPHSGSYAFWSNKGDESDMTLAHEFDLTGVKGPVSIQYSAWYDQEKDYDYTFLSVSEDGKTWKTLKTPSGTDKNPGGANLGWGYTGPSGGWKSEEVDLSAYAGKKIQLRFEYLTDAAVNLNGFMVDDISIPALNYQTDFEKDDGGWKADGFMRVANRLPQTFRVSLIKVGATTSIEPLILDPTQHGSVKITIGDGEDVILAVSGTTRFTTQTASFQFSVR